MKKYLLLIPVVILAAILLLLPRRETGDVSAVTVDYGESQFFTDREQEQAAKVLMDAFRKEFPDYRLKEIWYLTDRQLLEDLAETELEGRILIYYTDMEPKTDGDLPRLYRYKWYLEFTDAGTCTLLSHGQ